MKKIVEEYTTVKADALQVGDAFVDPWIKRIQVIMEVEKKYQAKSGLVRPNPVFTGYIPVMETRFLVKKVVFLLDKEEYEEVKVLREALDSALPTKEYIKKRREREKASRKLEALIEKAKKLALQK